MSRLISVMTSRCPRDGLRPLSERVVELEAFQTYLDDWEAAAEKAGGGFISKSTAEGMRVTLCSTLSLLKYVAESLGFKYLLTSRLSQDKLENTFGIVRQYCGMNDHPSPGQFLVVVNCLGFYNLTRPSKHGNSPANLVSALLDAPSPITSRAIFGIRDIVEDMLEVGDIDGASSVLQSLSTDDSGYVVEKNDSRLIFYIAGYVARKFNKKSCCQECISSLAADKRESKGKQASRLVCHFDRGGLLYPCDDLANLVSTLEEAFIFFFSTEQLHAFSAHDFMQFLAGFKLQRIGCEVHSKKLTAKVVQFFVLTWLHFFTKSLNRDKGAQRN